MLLEEAAAADEEEEEAAAADEAEDGRAVLTEEEMTATEVWLVVAAAEVVPVRTEEPDPVVVTAPVVAIPEVAALELRQELDEPAWMVNGEE